MTLVAGAARRDISPSGPLPLAGYPHVERVSTGVHDPLLASAIFLENEGRSALLVALDLLYLDPPTARELRGRIAGRLSVPQEGVFVSCTHTHSGPLTVHRTARSEDPDAGYMEFMKEQVARAAEAAASAAREAELAWATAEAQGVGGNRLSPDGVTDREVGILAARERGGGRWIGLAVIYGMHPTVLHEDSTLVSSDFPGYTRAHLQEALGDELVVVYQTAPAGNQSPRYHVEGQTFEEAERLGRSLGAAVLASLRNPFESNAWLAGLLEAVELPRRPLPSLREAEVALEKCKAEYGRLRASGAERARVRTAECAVFGAEGTVALAGAEERGELEALARAYSPAEVQAVRIGEACVVGFPGELFAEYALALKERAPARTFAVSLVNGELAGYIVTPEAAEAGGYEATNALFDPAAGEVLVEAGLSLAKRLAQ